MQVRDEVVEHLLPGGRRQGRTLAEAIELKDKLKRLVLASHESDLELIRVSAAFFDKLTKNAAEWMKTPENWHFCAVPMEIDPMLPGITAAISYKSGKQVVVFSNGDVLTLEQPS